MRIQKLTDARAQALERNTGKRLALLFLTWEVFRVQGAGCRVQGAGCRVQGAGCRVQGSGFRVHSRFRAKREQLKSFYLKAKAIIWPSLSCVCHVRSGLSAVRFRDTFTVPSKICNNV